MEWRGARSRKLSTLHTADHSGGGGLLQNLPDFPWAGVESKRCWTRRGRAGPVSAAFSFEW